jgi:hypothetical protein
MTVMCFGHVARTGEMRGGYIILVRKPVGKQQLGRPSRRCEDNIVMSRLEIGWKMWIGFI